MADSVARVLNIEKEELPLVLLAALFFFCVLCGYYFLRPVGDAMGVSGGMDDLFVIGCLVVFSGLLVVDARAGGGLTGSDAQTPLARGVGYTFYVWLRSINLLVNSVFWAFMVDVFSVDAPPGCSMRGDGFVGPVRRRGLRAPLQDSRTFALRSSERVPRLRQTALPRAKTKTFADNIGLSLRAFFMKNPCRYRVAPAQILQKRRLPEGARRADRSACDRTVPAILRTGVELLPKPSSGHPGAMVWPVHRVHSAGSRCPHFNVEEPGDQPRRAAARPT